jgi:hypothetical protein
MRPDRVKLLLDRFTFQKHEIPPFQEAETPRVLNFRSGEIEIEGNLVVIDQLNFLERRILVKIIGSTHELNSVFTAISSTLEDILDGFSLVSQKAILQTDQTDCMIELDIDYMSLFSLKFRKFIKNNLPKKIPYKVDIVTPKRLTFELSFIQPIEYRGRNIALSPRLFTIEPRENTALGDRIFFTSSPCPSDVHISLIKEFEEAFKM